LEGRILPLADRIMQSLLTLLASANKGSTILEDAFLAIGAIAQGQYSLSKLIHSNIF
jgi:importin subunit beta-1